MSGTRRKPDRMGPHIDGFRAWLETSGYTPGTVRNMLKEVGHLGRWMDAVGVEAAELDWELIEAFRAARSVRSGRVRGRRSLRPLMDYLGSAGVIARRSSPSTPVGDLIAAYGDWLVDRGLAAPTVLRYVKLARRFLEERFEQAGPRFVADLVAADVVGFLLRESSRLSVGAAKGRVAELRALLRFLFVRGLTPWALASAVPPVAGWHDTGLPVGLAQSDVQRLLDSCDRDRALGVRDFAILTLVARLGLRSIEVARLELGDIEWRVGEIVVRGKGRRRDRLPLPATLARRSRPTCATRGRRHRSVRCSSCPRPRGGRSAPIRFTTSPAERVAARACPSWDRTACVTRWRPRCCTGEPPSSR